MLGRLDGYVSRVVIGSYTAGLLFMTLLFSLMDLLVRLGDYVQSAGEAGIDALDLIGLLARYYVLGLPVMYVTVAPFVSVIAGMFAVSRLMGANEVVPMLFTGRSMLRILRPVFAIGALSAGLMVVCWEYVIPPLTAPLAAATRALEGKSGGQPLEMLALKIRDGARQDLLIGTYEPETRTMRAIEMVDRGVGEHDTAVRRARTGTWDPQRADWALIDGQQITETGSTPIEWLGVDAVTPDLLFRLGKEGRETVQLSYSELLDLAALRPLRTDLVLAFHAHLTFPLANLILLVLAVPFAVHFERGSKVERVVFAILLCGGYLVFDLTCQSLGKATLHPVLAAWLPTILFGSLGAASISGMRT